MGGVGYTEIPNLTVDTSGIVSRVVARFAANGVDCKDPALRMDLVALLFPEGVDTVISVSGPRRIKATVLVDYAFELPPASMVKETDLPHMIEFTERRIASLKAGDAGLGQPSKDKAAQFIASDEAHLAAYKEKAHRFSSPVRRR